MTSTIKTIQTSEQVLFNDLAQLIEQSKKIATIQANSVMTMLFWSVGKRINEEILQNKRADYVKRIVATVATFLIDRSIQKLTNLQTYAKKNKKQHLHPLLSS
jgi:hypothetical protein